MYLVGGVRSGMANEAPGYNLVHPVYLDVPMMVSFLARLEGGVAVDEEQTSKQSGARERLMKGRAGLRGRFGPLMSADAEGEASTGGRDEDSLESKSSKHHTAASLFNLLYDYLVEDSQFTTVEAPDDLGSIRPGQLVEIAGEYLGNPLEEILGLLGAFLPYILATKEAEAEAEQPEQKQQSRQQRQNQRSRQRGQSRPPNEEDLMSALVEETAKQAVEQARKQAELQNELGMRLMLQMAKDITQVPVHDVLIETTEGVKAVLTVDSSYYSAAINEYLRAGDFRVIGKVTRVLKAGHTINLTRRTVMGASNAKTAQELIGSLDETELSLEVPDPIVEAPAIQLLPMAIFL